MRGFFSRGTKDSPSSSASPSLRSYPSTSPASSSAVTGPPRPIRLVYCDEKGKFRMDPEAVATLQLVKEPIGVVSVCGRARQGKSFILNQLLGRSNGFQVASTHKPCTKGLWLWSSPIKRTALDGSEYNLLLLDSEGIDAYDQTGTYSTQIFSLAVLLSSMFVYNQMGGIDEASLDRLSLVTQMTKHIRVKASGGTSSRSELGQFSPIFVWLLRDFYLDLVEDNRKISPRDYLEIALRPVQGSGGDIGSKNEIRDSIRALFPDRECFPLVRPLTNEKDLQRLDQIPLEDLRAEFGAGLDALTKFVFEKTRPKQLGGTVMTGPILVGITQSYLDALNNGAVPTITSSWQSVEETECRRAYDSGIEAYLAAFDQSKAPEEGALREEHEEAVRKALAMFNANAVGAGLARKIKPSVIDLCSSDEEDNDASRAVGEKRARSGDIDTPAKRVAVEEGIGQSSSIVALQATPCNVVRPSSSSSSAPSCKQFWKAGDYEGTSGGHWEVSAGGFDHVRVHPKFLHSNATSHKWALGAFAELLDNALDEVHSGATYVNVNMLNNKKDGSRMLLIEDNGGGMNPEKMRHCMSLGYSAKSKLANTIGQYGNGFKTSTMRLGADVIVFSRCPGKDGDSFTQTIGLLSYTFLKSTGKEDIVVPMLDYERDGSEWSPIVRSSVSDWNKNVDTIVQWSPFSTEDELLCQFNLMKEHGTRIIIYNLWEDDQGLLELDFDTDPHDIQLRGVNRDEKSISMAAQYPNSRHFLTYRHSLRSYVSILYLRVPPEFRIILRGRDVEHHNIVNDMMHTNQITYRPKEGPGGQSNFSNMSAVVTIGFVKDAKHHVDVQGFNVYHKNRLIKPFWRIWNAAGSQGRGIIGVLEADFVEPAHDKQGFERTTVLSRLETRLLVMQKNYWRLNCHRIGYVSAHGKKSAKDSEDRESSPEYAVSTRKRAAAASLSFKTPTAARTVVNRGGKGKGSVRDSNGVGSSEKSGKHGNTSSKFNGRAKARVAPPAVEDINSDEDSDHDPPGEENVTEPPEKSFEPPAKPRSADSRTLSQLEQENETLKERLNKKEAVYLLLQEELRREKELRKKLEAEVQRTKDELEDVKKEQESLIDIFSEDRDRRDKEEEDLRNKLEEASNTIQALRGRR